MAFLRGFGAYLPPRVVGNQEMAALTGAAPEWILNVSGIEERRFAAPDQSVADLATAAAENCLERCALKAADLGMVIVASGTAGRSFPGPSLTVAHRLGLAAPPALDLPLPSAGSLFALSLASRLAPTYGHILVVAAEKMSTVIARRPIEPGVAVLFGDGAGACIVSSDAGMAEVVDSVLYSDGAFSEELHLDFDAPLAMNGRAVIMQASRKIPRAISELLARHHVAAADVDVFLMHQANQNLIDGVARALGVPSAGFYSNIRRYGNTSAASMLIAAAEWSQASGFRANAPVVFAGFGGGFHWGALLARRGLLR
jgi:3-oxoacyl-[acyl-carrier-protein] synthase-3